MIFLALILVFLTTAYFYTTRNFNYWKKRGVKHDKPIPFFGNNIKGFFMKQSISQKTTEHYKKFPEERVVGYYGFNKPEIIIRDPELIKRILITDFSYFHYRSSMKTVQKELILQNLFNAEGDLWRLLRQRLTPAFTSGKLKAMFPLIVERAERLHARIQAAAAAGTPVDVRDLMARFTTDFIGACGFGIDMDALQNDDSEFRKLGTKIFALTFSQATKIILKTLFPIIFKNLSMTKHIEDEIVPLVQSILKERNYQPSSRNDFIDLLLECQKKGTIVGESIENFKADGIPEKATLEMNVGILAAQAFVFFAAGFETSSSTTSYTLHLLAYNPEEQRKVQENIDKVLSKYENKLCYDAIKEMNYLEWAFKESMRIFPSVGVLSRSCARNYKVADMDLTIEKGMLVNIPVAALQNDPQYFDKPEEFRPQRFSPENFDSEKLKFVYMPFGDGPRACIGERLALMQSLAGLAAVLSKFTVEPAPTSVKHPVVDRTPSLIQTIKAGLPLCFRERK